MQAVVQSVWGGLQDTACLKSSLARLPGRRLVVLEWSSLGAPRCRRDGDKGSQGGRESAGSSFLSRSVGCLAAHRLGPYSKAGKTECIIVFRCNITLPGTEVRLSVLPAELSLNQKPPSEGFL